MIRRFVIGATLVTMLATFRPMGAAAEEVGVRASRGEDFGRIVFVWQKPVSYSVSREGKRLSVKFGRPIEASYQRVLGALSPYVRGVAASDDGREVRFELTREFDAYGFDSGSAVIVEIAEPLDPPPPGADVPKVRVRTGAHAEYTRIVFDWPTKVAYEVKQTGGVVSVRFSAAAALQIAGIKRRPPRLVGDVQARTVGDTTVLRLAVPATSKVRHFLSGSKVVLDVREPTGSDEIAALPAAPAGEPAPKPEPETEPKPKPAAETEPKSATASASSPKSSDTQPAPATAPKKAAVQKAPIAAKPATDAAPSDAAAAEEKTRTGSEATAKTAAAAAQSATPSLSTPATTTTAAATAATAATVGQPLALKPVPAQAAKPKADGESAEAAKDDGEKTADGEPAPPPEPKSPKAGVKLKFAWDEPVAAAVFRRVGFIWVIFDKASKVDVQSLLREGTGIISGIDQAPTPTATVLRFKTSDRVNPRLLRDGLSWIIEFREQPLVTASPFEIKAQPDSPVGARIFVPVPEPGQPVGITDPEIGDNLVVIPVIPLGHGTAQAYTYSQVRILQTAQGIVVKPLVDDLRVRPLRQGVELTSGAKLALTPVSADVAASAKLSALKPLTKIFELDKWELKDTEKFIDRKQELQNEVAVSRGEQRELKRYNLARFFFANRFTAETLGVLDRMKGQRPEVEDQPEYRLIRGAASYLMGRLSDAAADFTHESLDGTGEANFWRAAVVAASGDLLAAAPELRRTGSVTRKYPRALKIPMGTLVADAAVEIGDIKTAKTFIDALKALSPGPAELAQVEFVEGRLLDLGGDVDGAITKWEAVQESRHGPSRAKATIARMELLLKLRRMEPKEAIEILERLRYAWRGDDFEFRLLRRLGGLYLDEGIYRNGLQALRQAATYFRDNEEAPQVTQQMADVFNGLYLDGNADSMPPVTAIAVYEEFKELTPAGVKGDEMIRKLADRLAGVDLLEQAAEILEGQIRFRLKGALKAEVGARLSVLYLLARYYDRSLAALDATNEPGQPEGLVTQRRHLRARALMGMGREEESLEILKKDKAPDADLLRAEIFWRSGDWANASQSLRKIVRESGAEKEKPLNPEQSQNVLNYSIALVLSGNERGLGRVRRDYGRALEATELKDAFRLVSAPTAFGLIDPASVERRVKLAEGFKTFLSAYKERLQKQGLSGMTSQTTADAGGAPGGAAGQSGERQGETKGG